MHSITKTAFWGLSVLTAFVSSSPFKVARADAATLNNPVIWQDYPDLDVFRIGDVFYYSSSTFAFSPGAPVLKSYDLANWAPVSHSVPRLNFGPAYDLNNATSRAYVKGIWASTLQYRESTDTFYWMGCIGDGPTYVWTATGTNAAANNGEVENWDWTSRGTLPRCYYDNGLLIDDDDTMYMAYGKTTIEIAQLNADGTAEVRSQAVYTSPDQVYIEGSRMYKINGTYYLWVTKPADDEYVLKSDNIWGPYERRVLVDSIEGPLSNAGNAHQGGIVSNKDGQWYYVAFLDAYPGGRIPVVAPLTWTEDGWPEVVRVNNEWGKTYPIPVQTNKTVPVTTGLDTFEGPSLSEEWEWNHNPDNNAWSLDGGLQLQTATVTDDLFSARNTLTRRIPGPRSSGTFRIDISGLQDGDRAGAVLFRDIAGYIGVHKSGNSSSLVMVDKVNLGTNWVTNSTGTVAATGPTLAADATEVWLRIQPDITPAFSNTNAVRTTTFWYSLDGKSFTQLGEPFEMTNTWQFFTGYRFGVFNFATKALGGHVMVRGFDLEMI
ncbi:glycosyl hydrolase family 43 [Stagonosporopsis vannaccii]|nr:glycosyl hydrolase family 43 [Stagonosporopsis vannaccii]